MPVATVTSKGQMTIPKEIRDRLGVKPGDRVELITGDDGRIVMRRKERLSVKDLFGSLPSNGHSLEPEEIDEAIAKHAAERFERSGE